jgi:hypothetical protein
MERVFMLIVAMEVCAAAQAGDTAPATESSGLGTGIVFNVAPDADARQAYSAIKRTRRPATTGLFDGGDARLARMNNALDFALPRPALNRFEAMGRPNIGLGGISAKVETGSRSAPYLGLGKGVVPGAGPNFYADVGVMLTGIPSTALSLDCTGLGVGQCLALQNQNTTAEQSAFRAYPALNIGITFGF